MDIYAILSTRSHNPHYLNRYIRFIKACQVKNLDFEGYTEKHHICPKADDMFPEYICFRENPWNCVILKPRQHYIAHVILYKAYPLLNSPKRSLWFMTYINSFKLTSRMYEELRNFTRDKMIEHGKIGYPNPNKGKTYEEIYGYELAIKLKQDRSESNKRRNKDKKFKEKTGKAISETRKKLFKEGKLVPWNKGNRIVSQQQKEKISRIRKEFLESGLTRKEFAEKSGINYSTLKPYLRGL